MNLTIHNGRLAAAPRLVESEGNKRLYFTVACKRRKKKGAEEPPKPEYIPYVAFGKLAELCANLVKGQQVNVRGHQHNGKYKDNYILSNVADEVEFGVKPHKDNPENTGNDEVPSDIPGTEMDAANMDIPESYVKEMEESSVDSDQYL